MTNQPAEVPAPRKRLQACRCRFMAEKNWGYDIQKYVGGHKYWKPIGCAPTIETAEAIIASYRAVLVRCNGCGKELLRDCPPRAAIKSATEEKT